MIALVERRRSCHAEALQKTSVLAAIECSRCHSLNQLGKYLLEFPLPGDEICGDCARRSEGNGSECRSEWILLKPNFNFLCRDCREISVPC